MQITGIYVLESGRNEGTSDFCVTKRKQ